MKLPSVRNPMTPSIAGSGLLGTAFLLSSLVLLVNEKIYLAGLFFVFYVALVKTDGVSAHR